MITLRENLYFFSIPTTLLALPSAMTSSPVDYGRKALTAKKTCMHGRIVSGAYEVTNQHVTLFRASFT